MIVEEGRGGEVRSIQIDCQQWIEDEREGKWMSKKLFKGCLVLTMIGRHWASWDVSGCGCMWSKVGPSLYEDVQPQ